MLKELVLKNRSYRRFYQNSAVSLKTLNELVSLARITPSAANLQPLKYILSNSKDQNEAIFKTLVWAGYLSDWTGPEEGEKPASYIIVLGDRDISKKYNVDPGIAMQTMLLGAVERGLGGCIFASIHRDILRKSLSLSDRYEILYVVALGKPKEEVIIEEMKRGDVKYWRSDDGKHHVPKRTVSEFVL